MICMIDDTSSVALIIVSMKGNAIEICGTRELSPLVTTLVSIPAPADTTSILDWCDAPRAEPICHNAWLSCPRSCSRFAIRGARYGVRPQATKNFKQRLGFGIVKTHDPLT